MTKFLDLDGLETLVGNIASFVERLVTNLTTGKFIDKPTSNKYTDIAPGVSMLYYRANSSTAAEFRYGITQLNSTSSHYSYVYLSRYQAYLRCQNTYVKVTSSAISFYVNGTGYTLNVAKAKELGVLS